jgi:hypothetical protein
VRASRRPYRGVLTERFRTLQLTDCIGSEPPACGLDRTGLIYASRLDTRSLCMRSAEPAAPPCYRCTCSMQGLAPLRCFSCLISWPQPRATPTHLTQRESSSSALRCIACMCLREASTAPSSNGHVPAYDRILLLRSDLLWQRKLIALSFHFK